MNKLNNTNKLNKITFSINIIIFLLFSCGILCQTYIEKTCLLYDNSLRFHVRADSDEKEAQERKLIVRDAILQYVKTDVEQAHSARELKQTLAKKQNRLPGLLQKLLMVNRSGSILHRKDFQYDIMELPSFPPGNTRRYV